MATATCWLRIEPEWSNYYRDDSGNYSLRAIKVAGVTQKRPVMHRGTVVQLKISIPDQAFKPLRPEVTIEIPAEALNFTPDVQVVVPGVDG